MLHPRFFQTLSFNLATICAIIVGILQYAFKSYQKNNGS